MPCPHTLRPIGPLALAMLCLCATTTSRAAPGWNEATDGDLSGSGLAPSLVTLGSGSTLVSGTTGRATAASPVDRDYFTFTVPTGFELSALRLAAGTSVLGAVSFIGVQQGSTMTVSPTSGSAAGLLGWTHYGDAAVGTDLLPAIGSGAGASGFSGALGAGDYTVWVQDFGLGSAPYGFELQLTAAVPEPATAPALLLGAGALLAWRRRRAG